MCRYAIIIVTSILFICSAPAQTPVVVSGDDLLLEMESRFLTLDTLVYGLAAQPAAPSFASQRLALQGIDSVTPRETALRTAIDRRVEEEVAEFKSDLGLQLTGQTYYRLDGIAGFDEDDPQSRYNGKVQVEARWYILQSSLFKRRGQIRAIELQGEIDRTAQERDRLDQSVYLQKEYFRLRSDSLLSGVLQHRVVNLGLLSAANLYLLDRGDVSSDELLKILDDKAEAERQLATLRPGMPPATDLSSLDAYVVSVDTAALLRHIKDTSVDLRLLQLRLQQLEQERANTSYWSKCNLAPFVRYSYYVREYAGNSSNIDAGLSFTVPINNTASHRRRVLQAQQKVLEAESMDVLRQVVDRVRFYATEIDRLNRASEGEVSRMQELKGYLQLRAKAYDNRLGQYNRLSRLKEYNNYLVCCEKLISLQYQRDCYVADLQRLLTTGSVLDFCKEKMIMSR